MVYPWKRRVCLLRLLTKPVLLAAERELTGREQRLLAACEQLHKYNTSTRQNIAGHIRTSAAFISRIAFNRK